MLFPLVDISVLSSEELERRITDLRLRLSQAGAAHSSAVYQMSQAYTELLQELHVRQMTKSDQMSQDLAKKIDIS